MKKKISSNFDSLKTLQLNKTPQLNTSKNSNLFKYTVSKIAQGVRVSTNSNYIILKFAYLKRANKISQSSKNCTTHYRNVFEILKF